MTPTEARAFLPLIQAYADGQVVQWKVWHPDASGSWHDYDTISRILLCDPHYEWRIKPSPPAPKEWWICPECEFAGHMKPNLSNLKCSRHYHKPNVPMVRVREVLPATEDAP